MNKNRFNELEGLRGIAAIIVALYHAVFAFYIVAILGHTDGQGISFVQNMRFEDNLYANPIMVFLSGTFSVAIFFVLSGFVLSVGFFQTRKLEIIKKLAAKRYLRLMLPALASIMICLLLIGLGFSRVQEGAAITHSNWLLGSWNVMPNFFSALYDGVIGIFTQGQNSYNNVLWTMTTEFAGSFLIFGFLALFGTLKNRWILYIALIIITLNTWFMAFAAGMILADLYTSGILKQKRRNLSYLAVLGTGLFLGGFPLTHSNVSLDGTPYGFLVIPGIPIYWNSFWLSIGAIILVATVLSVTQLANIFRHRYISKLGKYTFSLYLTHLPILYTFTMFCFLELRLRFGLGYNASALIAIALSVPVVIIVAWAFEKYVDGQSIRFSSFVANKLLSGESLTIPYKKIKRRVRTFVRKVTRPKNTAIIPQEEVEI